MAEIVYFARTGASYLDEGFKDAKIYVDDFPQPVAEVTFEPKHGAQRVFSLPDTVLLSILDASPSSTHVSDLMILPG
ncbi:MAG: hypothetical protein Q4C70_01095 [Planctomycetia bacterium]|nr:hypothetical protein [Planctomycetia bacterium]